MRSTLARALFGAVLTLSGAAAGSPARPDLKASLQPRKEIPVAVPQPKAPPPSCETAVRVHQATLARSAPLDAAAVRTEFPELSPNASTLQSDECKRATAELLRDLALRAQNEAQGKRTIAAYEFALDLYRAALRHAQGPDHPRLRFGSAEVLFRIAELGTPARYCEAAPIYSEALETGAVRREDAAYDAIVAWDRCLDGVTSPENERGSRDEPASSPRPFRPPVQSLFAAMTAYIQAAAGSPPTPTLVLVKYRRGRILHEHNRLTEAIPVFREITEKHPGSEVGVPAAKLLLDSFIVLYLGPGHPAEEPAARFEEFSGMVERMLAEPLLTRDRELAELLHKILFNVGRKRVEQTEKAGLWSQAADGYMALATRFPQEQRRPELIYNAAVLFDRSHRVQDANAAREQLVKQHPNGPLAQKSLFRLAQGYAALAEYERAAEVYEELARRFPAELARERASPSETDGVQGLAAAIQYRAGLGQRERAFAGVDQLLKICGAHTALRHQAGALILALGGIYDESDGGRQKAHLLQLRKLLGPAAPIDLQIVTAARLGELAFRAACPVATMQGLCLATPTKTRVAVALARKPALVREAGTYFSQVLQAYRNGAAASEVRDDPPGSQEARIAMLERAVARVRLLKADQLHEEAIAAGAGTGKEREGRQREALGLYQLVLGMPAADGNTVVMAAARVAQLQLSAARASCQLVPGTPCGQLSGAAPATGVWAQAEQALARCVEVAAERTAPEWAGLCAAELHLLRPGQHRLDAEVRVVPDHPSPLIDRAPVLVGND